MMTQEAAEIIEENGTWVAPNMYLIEGLDLAQMPPLIRAKGEYVLPFSIESFKRANEMGLKIASGSDAGVYPHGDNASELVARVGHGMTPSDAIRSATMDSARALGTPDRGQIQVGLMADLIAVSGNPVEDITLLQNIPFVMKKGVVYKQEL